MRLAAAIAVIAVTLSAAVYVHQRNVRRPGCAATGAIIGYCKYHPSWEDPVAVLLAVGGIAVAVATPDGGGRDGGECGALLPGVCRARGVDLV